MAKEYSEVITVTTTASDAVNHIDLATFLSKNCTCLLLINEDTTNFIKFQTDNKDTDAGSAGNMILRPGASLLIDSHIDTDGFSMVADTASVNVLYEARA